MKRFMLVSLMSCMLVGQVSCDWNFDRYINGVGVALFGGGLFGGLGRAACGTVALLSGNALTHTQKVSQIKQFGFAGLLITPLLVHAVDLIDRAQGNLDDIEDDLSDEEEVEEGHEEEVEDIEQDHKEHLWGAYTPALIACAAGCYVIGKKCFTQLPK